MAEEKPGFRIGNDWDEALERFVPFVDLEKLDGAIREKFQAYPDQVNPPYAKVFHAFQACPLSKLKVVLLGQDPYPGHGVADGLAFSTSDSLPTPASLLNIHQELNDEFGMTLPVRNDLSYLADQGVFLYNTCLISRDRTPMAFAAEPLFQAFSKAVVQTISKARDHVVFILLGRQAQAYRDFVDETKHTVLTAPHPSPLSAHRGFFGSGIFLACNEDLSHHGRIPIDWLGIGLL